MDAFLPGLLGGYGKKGMKECNKNIHTKKSRKWPYMGRMAKRIDKRIRKKIKITQTKGDERC